MVSKSVFFSTTTRITSQEELGKFLQDIRLSKDCIDATHNMAVWRFRDSQGNVMEGADEEGEKGAGERMMFLMQQMHVINRVSVCTRFKGGANLGPQRFKLINDSIKASFELAKQRGWLETDEAGK